MKVDLRTLVLIRKRMEAAAIPLLFHEIKTPVRQERRISRIMKWMGPLGQAITREYVMLSALPPAGARVFGRDGRA